MALKSLVGISLEPIAPARETIRRLLDGASRHIADAKVQAVSAETRFGSAYTAVRMLADVGTGLAIMDATERTSLFDLGGMTIDLEALLTVRVDIVTSGSLSALPAHRHAMAAEIMDEAKPIAESSMRSRGGGDRSSTDDVPRARA